MTRTYYPVTAFGSVCQDALARFAFTENMCVAVCAYISSQLKELRVPHEVCLGSLSCKGTKVFQYRRPFPTNPQQIVDWEGHAWIDLGNTYIGEASLTRSARAFPAGSNIKLHLEHLGLLQKGAFAFDQAQRDIWELKYTKKSVLKRESYVALIAGLKALNGD